MIGNDNDKRTGRYSGFTLKIDNDIVGRITSTRLMHTSALNASCPTRNGKRTKQEVALCEKTRDFFLAEKRKS